MWRRWKYKNLTLLFGSLALVVYLKRIGIFEVLVEALGDFGYLGAFLAGMMFVLTFTVTFGAVLLFELAEKLTIWEVGVIAGVGAVFGDLIIFKFVRSRLIKEIEPIYSQFGGKQLSHVLHTKYFSWTLPVIGALVIASPLPDEVGVSLMGLSKIKTWQFILISLILNVTGIILILLLASIAK